MACLNERKLPIIMKDAFSSPSIYQDMLYMPLKVFAFSQNLNINN